MLERMNDASFAAFSRPLAAIPHLASFVGGRVDFAPVRPADDCRGVLVWGDRPTTRAARRALAFAQAHGLPVWRLEDGFLRTLPRPAAPEAAFGAWRRRMQRMLPARVSPPEPRLSLMVDARAAYFDARTASDLERTIVEGAGDAATRARAARFRQTLVQARATKYAGHPSDRAASTAPDVPSGGLLVVDQIAGDASLAAGLCEVRTFVEMLEAARDEAGGLPIVIKPHPMAGRGGRRGALEVALEALDARRRAALLQGVHRLPAHVDALQAIERASRVLVATSHLGFEALLAGKDVACFGTPWYARWGLTHDRGAPPPRGADGARRADACAAPRTLDDLVDAAYLRYPRYVDPVTGRRQEAFEALEQWRLNVDPSSALHGPGGIAGAVCADGMSCATRGSTGRQFFMSIPRWKRRTLARFACASDPRFVARPPEDLRPGDVVHVWGHRASVVHEDRVRARGATLVRIEDGFLRSIGLGSDFVEPLSLAFDAHGIYYDATVESGIEHWLARNVLDDAMRERAVRLRESVVRARLTKYNLAHAQPHAGEAAARVARRLAQLRERADGRALVLVPGQVDGDASILLGATGAVRSMHELLAQVRAANPEAFVVWRPHPEVLAGNRRGVVIPAPGTVDEIVTDVETLALLDVADEVHVLTSLVGFDALLRGVTVVTYGQPFYAGWGLTRDLAIERPRPCQVGLDALVHAALIAYPRYRDPLTGWFMRPESAIDCLLRASAQRSAAGSGAPARRGARRAIGGRIRGAAGWTRQALRGLVWVSFSVFGGTR